MSTYYEFACKKCGQSGGLFTRQAWGWGNFEIIESFKFICQHVRTCGHQNIGIIDESSFDIYTSLNAKRNTELREEFLKATEDIFPRSNE